MAEERFPALTVAEAADIIARCGSALIVSHKSPDGDAVGSATALKKIFESLGRRAAVAVPTPVPDYCSFLTEGEDILYRDGEEKEFGALIAVDVASPAQLGELSRLADKFSLMIDHHASGEAFAPHLTVPSASAAGEVVYDIYEELALRGLVAQGGADVARSLYAAISSDTGSFKYSNTTPKTFRIAAALSERINGADDGGLATWDISRLLHDTVTEKDLRINAFVADRIKLFKDGSLSACLITADDMKALGAEDRDMGGAIDVARSLAGVEAAVTVRQSASDPNEFKISARANADVDVAAVCASLGGGGHRRAAGATIHAASPEEAFSEAVRAFMGDAGEYGKGRCLGDEQK